MTPRPFHSALAMGLLSVNEAMVLETRQEGSQHSSQWINYLDAHLET